MGLGAECCWLPGEGMEQSAEIQSAVQILRCWGKASEQQTGRDSWQSTTESQVGEGVNDLRTIGCSTIVGRSRTALTGKKRGWRLTQAQLEDGRGAKPQ